MIAVSLTPEEEQVIEAFRTQQSRKVAAAYHQALVDVSGLLSWLTAEPSMSTSQLAAYCLAEFERANKNHPESAITKTTDFYRKVIEEKWPGCLTSIPAPASIPDSQRQGGG